ncbi:proto-oncogene Mas-like [Microcaecilia unicolor]|uniref:Proto-oncogene Mas-like n=1 Tax=Microcaecilia unicolor TaxID=1415580 RepID=A0A6P7X129_9AMPH|nr:proto-oncogene Mas-like [Microcaecilia unicolor]
MAELSTISLRTTVTLESNGIGNYSSTEYLLTLDINLLSLTLVFSVLGLVGNGIVLWFLGFRIKRNNFTIYILNLALADFLFLLCSCVIVLSILLMTIPAHFHQISLTVSKDLAYTTGLYLLTAISLERCLCTLYPFWYHSQRSKHQSTVVCILLWVLSCSVTGIEHFFCKPLSWNQYLNCEKSVFLSTGVLNFLFFTPVMVFSSLTLFIKIQRSSQHQYPLKPYVVIVISVLVFLIFALPFKVMMLILNTHHSYISSTLIISSILFSVINSTANPFVYFMVGSQSKLRGRGSIKVALQRVFKQEVEEKTIDSNGAETEI